MALLMRFFPPDAKERAFLCFDVEASDIFAHKAEDERLDPAEDEDREHGGCPSRNNPAAYFAVNNPNNACR